MVLGPGVLCPSVDGPGKDLTLNLKVTVARRSGPGTAAAGQPEPGWGEPRSTVTVQLRGSRETGRLNLNDYSTRSES